MNRGRAVRRGCAVAALATLWSGPVRAQTFGVILRGSQVQVTTVAGLDQAEHDGWMVGGEGRGTLGGVVVRMGYAEGRLKPRRVGDPVREHAVGHALLGIAPHPAVEVVAGPQARAYLTADDRERWVTWVVQARVTASILAESVEGYAAAWGALTGHASAEGLFDRGRGGAVGLGLRPWPWVGLRLEYVLDEVMLRQPRTRDMVAGLAFGLCAGKC